MIISVDGADGVGKTSLAKKLSQALGFEFVGHPLWAMLKIKSKDSKKYKFAHRVQRAIFRFKESSKLVSEVFCNLLLRFKNKNRNRNIVLDRGFLSTLIYNLSPKTIKIFDRYVRRGADFDVNILLTCSKEERIERIEKRDKHDLDLKFKKVYNLDADLTAEYAKSRNLNCIVIDTTKKTEQQVFEEALLKIKQLTTAKSMRPEAQQTF